jgi:hypothetical protein
VRLEGLGQLKKFHIIGTRTRDIPFCSIVPPPPNTCILLKEKAVIVGIVLSFRLDIRLVVFHRLFTEHHQRLRESVFLAPSLNAYCCVVLVSNQLQKSPVSQQTLSSERVSTGAFLLIQTLHHIKACNLSLNILYKVSKLLHLNDHLKQNFVT